MGRNNKDFNYETAWLSGEITDDEAYEGVTSKKSKPLTIKQDSVTKNWEAK